MMEYFRKTFHPFESTYDFKKAVRENDPGLKNRIWVCWWQGLDNAPDIVKQCVKSIQNNAPNYTVTVITDDNYREFADIPAWIEEKNKKGIIPKAHFSDISIFKLTWKAEYPLKIKGEDTFYGRLLDGSLR